MQSNKSKWLMVMVIVLLIANTTTLVMFWMGRPAHGPSPKEEVKDFLVKELSMDSSQQANFEILRQEHHHAVDSLRQLVKQSKDHLFTLVKDPEASDSLEHAYATQTSQITEQIDLFTLKHFQKLRAICRPDQQRRFDELLHELIERLGAPKPPDPPPPGLHRPERPPPPEH